MPHIGEKAEFVVSPGVAEAVTAGASPFNYVATRNGVLLMSGGTVSLVQYGRAGAMYGLGMVAGPVQLRSGDIARITYLAAPSLTFLPN